MASLNASILRPWDELLQVTDVLLRAVSGNLESEGNDCMLTRDPRNFASPQPSLNMAITGAVSQAASSQQDGKVC